MSFVQFVSFAVQPPWPLDRLVNLRVDCSRPSCRLAPEGLDKGPGFHLSHSVPTMRSLLLAAAAACVGCPPRSGTEKRQTKKDLPLKTERTVKLTTDEGTWLSLDVSPDGRTIVFEMVGDIYALPIGGGQATRITEGPAFDVQPRFSPDGKQIAFVSDRSGSDNLWVMDADGKNAKAITKGEKTQYVSPEWTPDGRFLIVSRNSAQFAPCTSLPLPQDGGADSR